MWAPTAFFSAAGYDSVIHTLGNSRYHRTTLEHAIAYPGGPLQQRQEQALGPSRPAAIAQAGQMAGNEVRKFLYTSGITSQKDTLAQQAGGGGGMRGARRPASAPRTTLPSRATA